MGFLGEVSMGETLRGKTFLTKKKKKKLKKEEESNGDYDTERTIAYALYL